MFGHCCDRGILVTLENPSRSLFWETSPFRLLLESYHIYFSNSQMCMMGSERPKWTKLAANFAAISEMDIACDGNHSHISWGKVLDEDGKSVYATSLEAQYPRKFCLLLVQCVIRQLQRMNMQLMPDSLFDVEDIKTLELQTAARLGCLL